MKTFGIIRPRGFSGFVLRRTDRKRIQRFKANSVRYFSVVWEDGFWLLEDVWLKNCEWRTQPKQPLLASDSVARMDSKGEIGTWKTLQQLFDDHQAEEALEMAEEAAPELLEAAKAAVAIFDGPVVKVSQLAKLQSQLAAAIAKAEGRV